MAHFRAPSLIADILRQKSPSPARSLAPQALPPQMTGRLTPRGTAISDGLKLSIASIPMHLSLLKVQLKSDVMLNRLLKQLNQIVFDWEQSTP